MKQRQNRICIFIAFLLLLLSIPISSFAASMDIYDGIELTVIVNEFDSVNMEADAFYGGFRKTPSVNNDHVRAALPRFFDTFLKSNPYNKIHLVILHSGPYELEGTSSMELPGYKGISSRKHIYRRSDLGTPPNHGFADYSDCLKAMTKSSDPRLKPVVLSISTGGGLMDWIENVPDRTRKGPDYRSFSRGPQTLIKDLSADSRYLDGRVSRLQDEVSRLEDANYAFYSIRLFYDTQWDPLAERAVSSYDMATFSGEEIVQRLNAHANKGQNGQAYYLLGQFYGSKMMYALGKDGHDTANTPQALERSLKTMFEKMNRRVKAEESYKPSSPAGLNRGDVWAFKNYARNYGLNVDESFPYDIVKPYKNKHLLLFLSRFPTGGNCYGMSLTVALHKMGILKKEAFFLRDASGTIVKNSDPLNRVSKDSSSDLIHLYHRSQTLCPQKWFEKNVNTKIMDLVTEVEKIKYGGPPVLIMYEQKEDDRAFHTILAHDIRRDEKTGEYIIAVYDSNYPDALEDTYLRINPSPKRGAVAWTLKSSFPMNSKTGVIRYFSTGNDLKDVLDPFNNRNLTAEETVPPYLWIPLGQDDILLKIPGKDSYPISPNTLSAPGLDNIPEITSPGSSPKSFSVKIPEGNRKYSVVKKDARPGKIVFIANFSNQAMIVQAMSATGVSIDADGSVSILGSNGTVDIQLLRNKARGNEDLGYRLRGRVDGDIQMDQTSEGLKLNGTLYKGKISVPEDKTERILGVGTLTTGLYGKISSKRLPFSDINERDWYASAVDYVYSEKLMQGTKPNLFKPRSSVTRAEMAQIIYNIAGKPKTRAHSPFEDVTSKDWYYDAIRWVAARGWIHGYGNGVYGPNDPIRRQDVAVLFHNIVSKKPAKKPYALDEFRDKQTISPYAKNAIKWAVGENIFKGDEEKKLRPRKYISRGEMAQVLTNMKMQAKPKH